MAIRLSFVSKFLRLNASKWSTNKAAYTTALGSNPDTSSGEEHKDNQWLIYVA